MPYNIEAVLTEVADSMKGASRIASSNPLTRLSLPKLPAPHWKTSSFRRVTIKPEWLSKAMIRALH